jgi:Leu/Phe-tRNA-protein transferase
MRKMTKQLIYMVISLTYLTPSYGITFISGSEPIKNRDNYYWWIENDTRNQIKLTAWLSLKNHQKKLSKDDVSLNKTTLNNAERTIITVNANALKNNQEAWLNIVEENGGTTVPRLTRIRIR